MEKKNTKFKCPICGSTNWSVNDLCYISDDNLFCSSLVLCNHTLLGDYPREDVLTYVCNKCGYIALFRKQR